MSSRFSSNSATNEMIFIGRTNRFSALNSNQTISSDLTKDLHHDRSPKFWPKYNKLTSAVNLNWPMFDRQGVRRQNSSCVWAPLLNSWRSYEVVQNKNMQRSVVTYRTLSDLTYKWSEKRSFLIGCWEVTKLYTPALAYSTNLFVKY